MKEISRKAFTLIEMLIVIVIIGILAAALVPRLQSVQARARDSKRKVDLRTIANANEIHRFDYGVYAKAGTCSYNVGGCYIYSTGGYNPWIPMLSGVMSSLPKDPINNLPTPFSTTGNYSYMYGNVHDGNEAYFDLYAQLENHNDPDRCAIQQYVTNKPDNTVVLCSYPAPRWLLYVVSAY